jgi:leucyl-tRNA synthetase
MAQSMYDPSSIEAKWQAYWGQYAVYRTPTELDALHAKPKAYVLDMFPYPSGEGLHVGHAKGYTASDVVARVRRMQGYNVLHTMGWDAFGLPAERAAERAGVHPAVITQRNTDTFRRQMMRAGLSYDWEREINTSAPDYYKWTQWIFLRLYERGLAYLADVPVNWCAALGTVLSNEEVYEGKYIETGDPVERRLMRQWMLKITAYAERLLDDLEAVDWPESIKEMQRNWIGKSTGADVTFTVQGNDAAFVVFTTRPDTLFGATYCVLAPEHPLLATITTAERQREVQEYVAWVRSLSDLKRTSTQEKTGVDTGAHAINPANGQAVPIWISEYVLMSYGSGAIMAVPAHDERDHEFARKFDLPIIPVVNPLNGSGNAAEEGAAYTGDGVLINSGFLNGMAVEEAKQAMIAWLEQTGSGAGRVQYRLRDWLFSRQRYWGEPFPIIFLEDGSTMAVPDHQLPVELPELVKGKETLDGRPPLARASDDWLLVTLPDGRVGVRETNTMPQWAGSCWYYLRFTAPHNGDQPWDVEAEKYWMPVDIYIGGVEHAVLHLLYSRFWHKVLYDCGLVSSKEPFQQLFNQGIVTAPSYQDESGKYYYSHQVELRDGQWFTQESGRAVHTKVEKMSKSKLNVVSLDDAVDQYGADALRLYELFIGPLSAGGPWLTNGIDGVYRFLQRTWRIVVDEQTGSLNSKINSSDAGAAPELQRLLHKTMKHVTEALESLDKMNTAVSQLMVFANALAQAAVVPQAIVEDYLRLLAPMAPHICDELWQRLGKPGTMAYATWPQYDPALLAEDTVSIVVQINGKVRTVLSVASESSQAEIERLALDSTSVRKHLSGKTIQRVMYVPGKLINFVVA